MLITLGIYLGSIAGLVFGLVAGAFVIQGNLTTYPPNPLPTDIARIFFEAFLGGLALKGVTDAGLGSFKSKDEFDVTSAKFLPNGATITIKNKMQSNLSIQQVVVTHGPTN